MPQGPRVVVIGAGVAGAAIASRLAQRGIHVTVAYRAEGEGSSFTNQRWNHSGLLYPDRSIANKAWMEFRHQTDFADYRIATPSPARFLALDADTLAERRRMWTDWGVHAWGADWRPLKRSEYKTIGALATHAIGGFFVPDTIVDFPRLIYKLLHDSQDLGANILQNTTVLNIGTVSGRVRTVSLTDSAGDCRELECDYCIVAAGAWSNQLLHSSGIRPLTLMLRRCPVLVYERELVPSITTCLDVRNHNDSKSDVTLVPFDGKTLAAGAGFVAARTPDGSENARDRMEVERLRSQLVQCFPNLQALKNTPRVCTKTELRQAGVPNVAPQVFREKSHNVQGLLVAIPGKASFMFDLAKRVEDAVLSE